MNNSLSMSILESLEKDEKEKSKISMIKVLSQNYGIEPYRIEDVKYKKIRGAQIKRCFDNSSKYVLSSDVSKNPSYILGYFLHDGRIPIEHAWVKDEDVYFDLTINNAKEIDEYWLFFEISKETLQKMKKKYPSPQLYEYVKFIRL